MKARRGGRANHGRLRPSRARDARGHGALRFVLRFIALWLGWLIVVQSTPLIDEWAIRGTVVCLKAALQFLTGSSYAMGNTVGTGHQHFAIVSDCTPMMPMALFFSACIAFPATWRWKLIGVGSAAILLWIYNLTRVLLLFLVMARWPAAFDFIHVYLWQTVTLIVVFLLFVTWLRIQGVAAPPSPTPEAIVAASPSTAGR